MKTVHTGAGGQIQRKAFTAVTRAINVVDRTIDFTISTPAVDRMGDTLAAEGWKFESYMNAPVILWAHDATQPPVAKALSVTKGKDALRSRAQFLSADISPFADSIFRMYVGGFLSAVSVGFLPLKFSYASEKGREFGVNYIEQELLEFSCVPIPANPEALVAAKAAGIDTGPLRAWASQIMRSGSQDAPALSAIERERIRRSWEALPSI